MDYKCNLDCPAGTDFPFCCCHCACARKYFITDENKHLWDKKVGFWSDKGCRLARKDMPQECKEYDCHDYEWVVKVKWSNNKWKVTFFQALDSNCEIYVATKNEAERLHNILLKEASGGL